MNVRELYDCVSAAVKKDWREEGREKRREERRERGEKVEGE